MQRPSDQDGYEDFENQLRSILEDETSLSRKGESSRPLLGRGPSSRPDDVVWKSAIAEFIRRRAQIQEAVQEGVEWERAKLKFGVEQFSWIQEIIYGAGLEIGDTVVKEELSRLINKTILNIGAIIDGQFDEVEEKQHDARS